MKALKQRREFFELSETIDHQQDFLMRTKMAKEVSGWAADQLGYSDKEKQNYIEKNISNFVQTNEVHKMVNRIERDLFNANVQVSEQNILELLEEAQEMAHSILKELKK